MSNEPIVSPLTPNQSPLLEVDPTSINELIETRLDLIFNKPPALISDDDLRSMIVYYRRERERFLSESALKENAEKKPKAAASAAGGAKKKAPKSVADAMQESGFDFL